MTLRVESRPILRRLLAATRVEGWTASEADAVRGSYVRVDGAEVWVDALAHYYVIECGRQREELDCTATSPARLNAQWKSWLPPEPKPASREGVA